MPTEPIEEVPLDAVLTDAESEELMNFLESGQLPQDSMTFAVLDGFLTAIVVGPEEVPPSTWFPMIWGTPGDRPIFRSPDEEKRIRKLMMRAYNAILTPSSGTWTRNSAKSSLGDGVRRLCARSCCV